MARKTELPRSRKHLVPLAIWVHPETRKAIRQLALNQDMPVQGLMDAMIGKLLTDNGMADKYKPAKLVEGAGDGE